MESTRSLALAGGAQLARRSPALRLAADYFELTKPRVQTLLLLTTISAMYVAGRPSLSLVMLTCLGGYLSAGGAAAINHVLDRDIDARMGRTANRPIPAGRISPRAALSFGAGLGALSLVELTAAVNPLAAALSFGGFLGYVFIYTLWLKRRSDQNIVIGGAAGAVPPLVGWAAVRGSISATAVLMFMIVFFWTPAHFWALALLMKDEYARVGVPMLPVAQGERETKRQIVLYAILLYMVTQLPYCAGALGNFYLVSSLLLDAAFIGGAIRLQRTSDGGDQGRARRAALQLYLFSLLYLALLFAAMVIDAHLAHV